MFGFIQRHKRLMAALVAVSSIGVFIWIFTTSDVKQMLRGTPCVATVGDACITLPEYRLELAKLSYLLNDPASERLARRLALSSLVTREVLALKARQLGWRVSDEELLELLKSQPQFLENGRFSPERYRTFLKNLGLTPSQYEESLRKSVLASRLLSFVDRGVYVLPEELELQKHFTAARFYGKLYLLKPTDLNYEPTEQEVKRYYEKHKELFKKEGGPLYYLFTTSDKEEARKLFSAQKRQAPARRRPYRRRLHPARKA